MCRSDPFVAGHGLLRPAVGAAIRALVVLLTGFVAYLWSGLTLRVLICFDRTGLEPGEPDMGLPVDYGATWRSCLGPAGWIVGLGVFGLALAMALMVERWHWLARVVVAIAPTAAIVCLLHWSLDVHPWIRSLGLQIILGQMAVAAAAGLSCRRLARLIHRPCPAV